MNHLTNCENFGGGGGGGGGKRVNIDQTDHKITSVYYADNFLKINSFIFRLFTFTLYVNQGRL